MRVNAPELVRASQQGDLSAVRRLVESGADVNSVGDDGMGPLLTAPIMLQHLLIAAGLVAVTVAVHAAGFGLVLGTLVRRHAAPPASAWPITWLLVRLAWLLILIHVVEISVWALFYRWQNCLPDIESAFYFSGATYTTLGYGDVVLPPEWRLLAPLEGLTGILMCGLSAGLFFATVTAIYGPREQRK